MPILTPRTIESASAAMQASLQASVADREYARETLAAPVRVADLAATVFPPIRHTCPDRETGAPRLLPAKTGNTLRSYRARIVGIFKRAFKVAKLDATA